MDEWSEWPRKHLWYYLCFFLNQGIMFLKCLYLRNSIILYSVHWYRYNYVHIKQLYMWVTRVQFNVQCECCK